MVDISEVKTLNGDTGRIFKIEYTREVDKLKRISYITETPLGNCQIFSIIYCYKILEAVNAEEIFRQIIRKIGKSLMLIDIRREEDFSSYPEVIKKIFGEENIVFRQDYTNTYQRHEMSMYLINVSKFFKD